MDVQGKVVIVTGASMGIGMATARRFAAEGASVVLAARSAQALDQLADELRQTGAKAAAVPTDVRDPAAVHALARAAVEQFGRIDVLINNAGKAMTGTIADMDVDAFRESMELNVYGALYAMQAVIPAMRRNGGGVIVNVSSTVTQSTNRGMAGYTASKTALNVLSKTARAELSGERIRVILVFPNATGTDLMVNALGDQVMNRQINQAVASMKTDSPEFVAGKILQAVQKEPAEQFMR